MRGIADPTENLMSKREALIEMAVQHGVHPYTASAALEESIPEAVRLLLQQVRRTQPNPYVLSKYVEDIIHGADEKNRLLHVAHLLMEFSHNGYWTLSYRLRAYGMAGIELQRQIISLEWVPGKAKYRAAEGIFFVAYNKDAAALNDTSSLVRITAARFFEDSHQTEALKLALHNRVHEVRRIAAWYMGEQKVYTAVDVLCDMLTTETNFGTLRGVIWSLGMMRVIKAKPSLEILLEHKSQIVRHDAEVALERINEIMG